MSKTQEIRNKINAKLVAVLESGETLPWRRPWRLDRNSGVPANVVSKRAYRGINPLLLDLASMKHGFQGRWWGTWNQWKGLGGCVMRRPSGVSEGRWGTTIVFWSPINKTVKNDDGEESDDRFFVLKSYTVFCIDQVEGSQLDHLRVGQSVNDADPMTLVNNYAAAEAAIDATGADIRYGGQRAYYSPSGDFIQLPPASEFIDAPSRLLTTFHELCHWTEHPSRLNWSRKEKENTYGMGELVAELGGCYLARELRVHADGGIDSTASYLKYWIAAMKGDSGFIFRASSQASKAADHILSFSRPKEAVEEPEAALAC